MQIEIVVVRLIDDRFRNRVQAADYEKVQIKELNVKPYLAFPMTPFRKTIRQCRLGAEGTLVFQRGLTGGQAASATRQKRFDEALVSLAANATRGRSRETSGGPAFPPVQLLDKEDLTDF